VGGEGVEKRAETARTKYHCVSLIGIEQVLSGGGRKQRSRNTKYKGQSKVLRINRKMRSILTPFFIRVGILFLPNVYIASIA